MISSSLSATRPSLQCLTKNLLTNGNNYPTTDKIKKCLVIAGASAEIAGLAAIEAARRNYRVIALTTSNKSNPKDIPPSLFTYLKVKENSYHDPEEMTNLIASTIGSAEFDQLCCLHLIGGATAPSGRTLEEINFIPLRTVSQAISNISKGSAKSNLVYLSSIAGPLLEHLGDEYALSRVKADYWLMKESKHNTAHSIQPGVVIGNPAKTKSLISKHPYSIDQIVNTPGFTPLIGSGNQICESIVACDLIEAIFNCFERPSGSRDIIPAVTRYQYTQKELIEIYAVAMGKKITTFSIPPGMARLLAEKFPYGRLAPYSARLFEMRDTSEVSPFCYKKFESLLSRDPLSLEKILTSDDNEPFLSSKSPIFEHGKQILRTCLSDSKARGVIGEIIIKHGPALAREFSNALFRV
jgi:nucleoside-diphosphate-sugar epimerase